MTTTMSKDQLAPALSKQKVRRIFRFIVVFLFVAKAVLSDYSLSFFVVDTQISILELEFRREI